MKAFLVVILGLFFLELAATLNLKPGVPRPALSAMEIGLVVMIDLALIVWATVLLVGSA